MTIVGIHHVLLAMPAGGEVDACRFYGDVLALWVSDLDALCSRSHGAGVDASPDALLPGFRLAHVRDPFGNRLELLEPDPA